MNNKELVNSIVRLTDCINNIYDNGCLFDKLLIQMNGMCNEIEQLEYRIKNLTCAIEEINMQK